MFSKLLPPPGTVKMPNVPSTQPAIMKPTEEHPAYTQIAKEHALAQAELLKRQEELERKAAELDRREREMQNLSQHGRKNNWPPLPGNFPVGPCFYQDFSVDIPVEFQKTVHGLYRTTGASFEKAQQEFATGVMSNKTVQTAAANAASSAATSAAQNAFKGCNFCLCGEDSTDEGEDRAPDGGIEGPAQGAVSRPVGRRVVTAVAYGLLTAPAGRVEYQTQDQEQACKAEEKSGETPVASQGT
ncbi:hypothetical protein GH733_009824, partial [Mirounga leonina]